MSSTAFIFQSTPLDIKPICNPDHYDTTVELLQFLLQMLYLLPTVALYITLFLIVYSCDFQKEFNTTFWNLFGVCSVLSLFSFLLETLPSRILLYISSLCPWAISSFNTPSLQFTILLFITRYCNIANTLCNICLCMNRLTIAIVPKLEETIWKFLIPFSYIFILFVPFLLSYNTVYYEYSAHPALSGVEFDYQKHFTSSSTEQVHFVLNLCALVIITVGTIVTVSLLNIFPGRVLQEDEQLCEAGLIQCITLVITSAYNIYFSSHGDSQFNARANYYIQDLGFVIAPWSFVMRSSKIRTRLAEILCCRAGEKVEPLFAKKESLRSA